MRKGALLLAAGAVVVIAAAAAARYVVLPMVHQVPADLDTTSTYSGTVTMINPAALASGDASKVFLNNVPVTAEQRVKSVSVAGRTVVMSSDIAVKGPDGATIVGTNHVYALDRVSLEAVAPPAGSNAEQASGLALGFPLTPKQESYQYWDSNTQTANPANYLQSENISGRKVYVYATKAVGAVKDPKLAALLPTALPKSAFPALAAGLPEFVRNALNLAMPLLPASVPVSYAATTDTTFKVDAQTGVVIDVEQKQLIRAQLSGPLAMAPLPAAFDLTIRSTPDSVAKSVEQASTAQNGLMLVGTHLPIGLAALGGLMLILAIIGLFRRRKPEPEMALQADRQTTPQADPWAAGSPAEPPTERVKPADDEGTTRHADERPK